MSLVHTSEIQLASGNGNLWLHVHDDGFVSFSTGAGLGLVNVTIQLPYAEALALADAIVAALRPASVTTEGASRE